MVRQKDYPQESNYFCSARVNDMEVDPRPFITPTVSDLDESAFADGPLFASGQISVDYSHDGPGFITLTGNVAANGTNVTSGPLTSDGLPVVFTFDSNTTTYTGTVNGEPALELVFDPSNDTYTYTQYMPFDYADETDDGEIIRLSFEFVATDADGDRELSSILIRIENDPTIQAVHCFTAGSQILVANGRQVSIETLEVGDFVETVDSGLQPVWWIGKTSVSAKQLKANQSLRPILLKAGALGNIRDMHVSPNHRMFVENWRVALLFNAENGVLVAAKDLVNDDKIIKDMVEDGITYIHIMFDKHELVTVDGAVSESFYVNAESVSKMEKATQDEILTLFPELTSHAARFGPTARPSLNASEALMLL